MLSAADPAELRRWLIQRLDEPAPGRIQLVTGPRQVGKTTILLELATRYGTHGLTRLPTPLRPVCPVTGNDSGALPRRWRGKARPSSCWTRFTCCPNGRRLSRATGTGFGAGACRFTSVATGSSAQRVTQGSRESLAGRFERLVFAHWTAAALAATFNLSAEDAARQTVLFGTYPGAWPLIGDRARWRAYIRDAIRSPSAQLDCVPDRRGQIARARGSHNGDPANRWINGSPGGHESRLTRTAG